MAGSGRLQSDPLFQGLTRPTMILGVSYMYFVINAVICTVAFINTQSFTIVIPAALTTHLIGYLICLKEPRAMELIKVRLKKTRLNASTAITTAIRIRMIRIR